MQRAYEGGAEEGEQGLMRIMASDSSLEDGECLDKTDHGDNVSSS